mmetsp:Transcript_42557/g.77286  ORF Transcript_42557/g.77286 Transcript_42557/m.77286 type:complete len:107 (-) Transcript_42557:11-331(-)
MPTVLVQLEAPAGTSSTGLSLLQLPPDTSSTGLSLEKAPAGTAEASPQGSLHKTPPAVTPGLLIVDASTGAISLLEGARKGVTPGLGQGEGVDSGDEMSKFAQCAT